MDKTDKSFVIYGAGIIVGVTMMFGLAIWVGSMFRGDGIETGRTYALAYSYKATIRGGGGTPARVFDFADRSLPRTSVVVPLADDRGMSLVRENPALPPSTVRKVLAKVPTRTVEGVTYPGYSYVEWQYHFRVTSEQSVVPTVIPSK